MCAIHVHPKAQKEKGKAWEETYVRAARTL